MSRLEEIGLVNLIKSKIENGDTHQCVSNYIKRLFPAEKGTSARSVRRICEKYNFHRSSRLPDQDLDVLVSWSVGQVGPTYGRKMLSGFLASQGFKSSEVRVGQSLKKTNPAHHSQRQSIAQRSINPIPYRADYFGQKLHIDQNEKIVMYGVTHVCAIDGYSGKIVGFVSMPIKNNIIIYEKLYRHVVTTYGLWDQIRVDKGKEWYLLLFINEKMATYRYNTSKSPHLQTSSTKNHTIERIWVEVNTRVNYPLKKILNAMVENDEIVMDNLMHQYSVSWLTLNVCNTGTCSFVSSWNAHRIPCGRNRKRGIPNELMGKDNRARKVQPNLLPQPLEAVQMYTSDGGSLSDPTTFGVDPLASDYAKQCIRLKAFGASYSFDNLFHEVCNGNGATFKQALKYFIDITHRLSLSS